MSAAVGMRQNAPSDSTLHVRTISKEKCRRFLLERGFCSVLAEQDDRLRSDDSTDFLNLFARLRKGSRKTGDPARFLPIGAVRYGPGRCIASLVGNRRRLRPRARCTG